MCAHIQPKRKVSIVTDCLNWRPRDTIALTQNKKSESISNDNQVKIQI